MSKCIEKKVVSRLGKPHTVCSKYAPSANDDILVRKEDTDLGAYSIKSITGLGFLGDFKANDFIGPAVGGLGATLGTLLARRFGGKVSAFLETNPAIGGIALGVLASIPLRFVKGMGTDAMKRGIITAMIVGGTMAVFPKLESWFMNSTGAYTVQQLGAYTVQQMGATVPDMQQTNINSDFGVPRSLVNKINPKVYSPIYGRRTMAG